MISPQSLPWIPPLELAARLEAAGETCYALLHSSARASYSGRLSILACGLEERIEGDDFDALAGRLSQNRGRWDNAWFGYLGYGLKNRLEALPNDRPGWFSLPALAMMRFAGVYVFDHDMQALTLWGNAPYDLPPAAPLHPPPQAYGLHSPMSKADYLAKVETILSHIRAGDLYQANLTRKIRGHFHMPPSPVSLFAALCEASPAPYSALVRVRGISVISSSPELFLRMDKHGEILTRPIKGTAPRHADPEKDRESANLLAKSTKNRAENLMITDLMRNDLSRSCIPGSVKAEALFEVTTHATIHHMSSTVSGRRRAGIPALEAVKACFPPGSMTGAPKIQAMKLCSALEQLERGPYSGAIGWFGGDGSAELSVVIRTLIVEEERFEFQVGGGIVADSTPEAEWEETIEKSRGLLKALGLGIKDMPQ